MSMFGDITKNAMAQALANKRKKKSSQPAQKEIPKPDFQRGFIKAQLIKGPTAR